MSNKEKKRLERAARIQQSEEDAKEMCLMRFSENKFYNVQTKPIFEAGKVYRLQGKDWINRWIKRGGEKVEKHSGEILDGSAPGRDDRLVGISAPLGEEQAKKLMGIQEESAKRDEPEKVESSKIEADTVSEEKSTYEEDKIRGLNGEEQDE